MSEFIKKLDPSWVRGIATLLFVLAIIVGFFIGIVPLEWFQTVAFAFIGFILGKSQPTFAETKVIDKLLKDHK